MFKKHEFTCPDVVYLRNQHKKQVQANIIAAAVLTVGAWAYGTYLQKKEQIELQHLETADKEK